MSRERLARAANKAHLSNKKDLVMSDNDFYSMFEDDYKAMVDAVLKELVEMEWPEPDDHEDLFRIIENSAKIMIRMMMEEK